MKRPAEPFEHLLPLGGLRHRAGREDGHANLVGDEQVEDLHTRVEAAAHVPVSDDVAAQAELRDTMNWLMGQLAPLEADLVHKLAKGLNVREIASGTADPYGTVAVRVHRLRRRLVGLRRKM